MVAVNSVSQQSRVTNAQPSGQAALVGGSTPPSTNNTATVAPAPSSSGNFLQSIFSQTPQPAAPVATPQQIYGGGGEQQDATPQQIYGGGGEQQDATPKQIYGGGGEQQDATPQQIFGGTPSAPEVNTTPSGVVDHDKGSTSNPDPTQGKSGSSGSSGNATPSPAVQNATQVGLTPQAFADLLNNALVPNPLNAYYQTTYHFRLFTIGDQDVVAQAGNPSSAAGLLNALSSRAVKQVTIAESGVTGYSITNVEINTVMAQNSTTMSQAATTVRMTITEPLGVSFLDGFSGAATTLGVFDYTKIYYYLELTFTGYTDQGQYAKRPLPLGSNFANNGGVWIWELMPTNIGTKLNEGGGVYTLDFVTPDLGLSCDTQKITQGKSTLTIKGDTLGELFDNYVKEMNLAWGQWYSTNGKQMRTLKIITNPITMGPYVGQDIRSFKLTAQQPETSSSMLVSLDSNGKMQAQLSPGTSINDFIKSAINATEMGQKILKDEPAIGNTSQTSSQVNDRKFREMTTFSIELDPKRLDKEPISGNYIYEWDAKITPFYTQSPVIDATQVQNARDPTVQQKMIGNLIKYGLLRKRYDYIFTGKNTEVLDFNIDFNMVWRAELPKLAGARMGYNNEAVQARLGPIQKQQSDTKPQAAVNLNIAPQTITGQSSSSSSSSSSSQVDPGPTSLAPTPAAVASTASHIASEATFQNTPQSLTTVGGQSNPVSQATQAALTAVQNPSAAMQGMLTSVTKAISSGVTTAQTSQQRLSNTSGTTPSEASKNLYIEDLLNVVNQPKTNTRPPISFWQSYQGPEDHAGHGFTGQWSRDQSVVGAIFSQIYECPLTSSFFSIDPLTIRGDPFYLGQTNLERKMSTPSGPTGLPDGITSRSVIYVYFKYPVQMGDDFKPVLSVSESFNGLYEITRIKHMFSEGLFKQELQCRYLSLHDVNSALSGGGTGGGAGSSSTLAGAGRGGNNNVTPGSGPGFTLTPSNLPSTTATPSGLQSSDTTTVGNLSQGQTANMKAALGASESGNNTNQGNNGLGFVGQYQFGRDALSDAGYVQPGVGDQSGSSSSNPGTWMWTGKDGINSLSDFLASPQAQNSALNSNFAQNYSVLVQKGTITTSTTPETVGGLLTAAQLTGGTGAANWANSGGAYNPHDANGSTAQKYYTIGYNAVRLAN